MDIPPWAVCLHYTEGITRLTHPAMLRYRALKERQAIFRSFTSLSVAEFEALADELRGDWKKAQRQRHKRRNRERAQGGGRKLALNTIEDALLLTLVWLKLYSVYLVLEHLFNIDESTVSRTITGMLPLLHARFTLPEHRGRKKIKTLEELKQLLPDVDIDAILADATEQPILRPKHKGTRKRYHSGKAHDFTIKTQIATTRKGYILHVSDSIGGRRHDYRLFKRSGLRSVIPRSTPFYGDLGYEGVRRDYSDITTRIPARRPHRGDLSRAQKLANRQLRKVRIRVENTFAQLKKYGVLRDTYRHARSRYNDVFVAVANIFNFRMLQRGFA